jgi:hypothetical protein
MKNDLAEFTNVMSTDANNLFNQASSQVMEKSSSILLFNSSSTPDTEKSSTNNNNNNKQNQMKSTTSNIQVRYNEELKQIQTNEDVYLNQLIESNEDYIQWLASFNLENFKSVISDLLIENSSMRLLYSQLVPAQISNEQFWSRYFYRINQLDEEHKKRLKLLERVANKDSNNDDQQQTTATDWDDQEEEEKKEEEEIEKPLNNVKSSINNEQEIKSSSLSDNNIIIPRKDSSQEIDDDVKSQSQLGDEWDKVSDNENNNLEKLKLEQTDDLVNKNKQQEASNKVEDKEWDDWGDATDA